MLQLIGIYNIGGRPVIITGPEQTSSTSDSEVELDAKEESGNDTGSEIEFDGGGASRSDSGCDTDRGRDTPMYDEENSALENVM